MRGGWRWSLLMTFGMGRLWGGLTGLLAVDGGGNGRVEGPAGVVGRTAPEPGVGGRGRTGRPEELFRTGGRGGGFGEYPASTDL